MQMPLLTAPTLELLLAARQEGLIACQCSLDLQRSTTEVALHADRWRWQESQYPYPADLKDRTIYFWDGEGFKAASRYGAALIKLVPTEWGAPTFEIDGIKMLPTSKLSPYTHA
jgi:predicted methyltransferase